MNQPTDNELRRLLSHEITLCSAKVSGICVAAALITEKGVYVGHINESEIGIRPGYGEEMKWAPIQKAIAEELAFEGVDILKKYISMGQRDSYGVNRAGYF
jgi:hypothetical protein